MATKKETIIAWANLPDDKPILKHCKPIPYKATGSTYGACSIRIGGTPKFIDAVLSHLKEMLEAENDETRLAVSRSEVKAVEIKGSRKTFENAANQAEVCYIAVHERGPEAKMVNGFVRAFSKEE